MRTFFQYTWVPLLAVLALIGSHEKATAATWLAYDNPNLQYQGRIDFTQKWAEFDWPCTSLSMAVDGFGKLSLTLDGGGNRFLLTVDDNQQILALPHGKSQLVLADFATPGRHLIRLQKITEAGYMFPFFTTQSSVKVYGVNLDDSLQMASPTRSKKRLEFFGDSAMNGFGVEKASGGIHRTFSQILELEDCSKSYPIKVAALLDAEVHLEAWSGKGVIKNAFGLMDFASPNMPAYWHQTLATDSRKAWDFSRWRPDAIIIQLGANDHYLHPYPKADAYEKAYRELLETIIASYEPARPAIINICGFDTADVRDNCPHVKAASQTVARDHSQVHYFELDPALLGDDDWATLHHWSEAGNTKVAEALEPFLRDLL